MTYCRAKQHPPKHRTFLDFFTSSDQAGFTLVELIVVMGIIAALTGMALPTYAKLKDKAREARATAEIREIEKTINAYAIDKGGVYPTLLKDAMPNAPLDPWGHPYQYLNIANAVGVPAQRTDGVAVLNSDFDLYSMGPDGDTFKDVLDDRSRDDIIRSGDGGFVGLCSNYFPD